MFIMLNAYRSLLIDIFAGSPQSIVVVLFADQMQISSKPPIH